MTVQTSWEIDWTLSPRIVTVPEAQTEVTVQDIVDTCRYFENRPEAVDDDYLIDAAGKENLGGGVEVGITATFNNTRILFEPRSTPLVQGSTVTATDATGTTLTDSTATFLSDSLYPGCTVYNNVTGELGVMLSIDSDTQITHRPLSGQGGLGWTSGNSYSIYPNVQCTISGGNLVAVDDVGADLSPVLQSANVQVVRSSSSSATTSNQEALNISTFGGAVTLCSTGSPGTDFPLGTPEFPVDNLADAKTIADANGFDVIQLNSPWTFGATDDISGYIIKGKDDLAKVITLTAGVNTAFTTFRWVNTGGGGTVTGTTFWFDCTVQGLTGLKGYFDKCYFDGDNTLGGDMLCQNCRAGQTTSIIPNLDMNGASGGNLVFNEIRGYFSISNCTQTGQEFNASFDGAWCTLDSTNTGGGTTVIGSGHITDNSGAGHTVFQDYLHDPSASSGTITAGDLDDIADAVWDEDLSTHTVSGSAGQVITALSSLIKAIWVKVWGG